MYLIWYIVFVIGIAFILKTLCDIEFEDSVAMGQMGIIASLYLFYVVDLLEIGIIIILITLLSALVFAVIFSIKKKVVMENVRVIKSCPVYIYVGFLVLAYIVTYNKVPFWGDELRYWAAVPKVLFKYRGALQLNQGFQLFSVDYIPGISIYQYFLEYINGSWSDSLLFFAYCAIIGAMLLPITKKIKTWYGVIIAIGVIYITPLFFFNTKVNDYAVFYQSLYIDPIVGIGAGCLIWLFLKEPWKDKKSFVQFILYSSFVVLLKSSGIVFVLIADLALLFYIIMKKRRLLHKIQLWGGILFPVVLWATWNVAISYYQIGKELEYHIAGIWNLSFAKPFLNAIIKQQVLTVWFTKTTGLFSFLLCIIILTIILGWLYTILKQHNDNNVELLKITYIMGVLQVVVYVIGLYGLCANTFGGRLNSYGRYISTVLEMLMVFFVMTLVSEWNTIRATIKENGANKKKKLTMFIVAFLCLLIAPIKQVKNTENTYPAYILEDRAAVNNIFDHIIEEIEKNSWARVALVYDEPNWESDGWVSWAKQLYGHLLNNISYEAISHGVQVRQTHYYDSQMEINDLGNGKIICTLLEQDNWTDVDYIVMLHGNYVETPIHTWELYKINSLTEKRAELEFVAEGSKPEEFVNYH